MSANNNLEKEFHKIHSALDEATQQLEQGHIPALQPLESRIMALCQSVSASPPATAKQIQPLMGQAIQKLDILAQDLQTYQDCVKKEGS